MTEKTSSQLLRMINKIFAKYPQTDNASIMSDIHFRINQETGDVMVYDDNDVELTRIVVDEWIGNQQDNEDFYKDAANAIRKVLYMPSSNGMENGMMLGLMMPYSFVLETESGDNIEDLYMADSDDETIVVGEPFMKGLSEDLDEFIKHLFDE